MSAPDGMGLERRIEPRGEIPGALPILVTGEMSDSTPPRKRSARYSCIVANEWVVNEVDPRIHEFWPDAKFGDLRKTWRRRHCATLNPYGSEDCPYGAEDCALAYLICATRSRTVARDNPMGYFWKMAKSMALERADNKPLARDRDAAQRSRDAGAASPSPGPGHPGVAVSPAVIRVASGDDQVDRGLHGRAASPVHIGTLLGQIDLGPRQRRAEDGEEGTKR